MLAKYLGQVSVEGSFVLTPAQMEELGIALMQPQGPVSIYVDQYGPQACFSGIFTIMSDAGPTREYACVRLPYSLDRIAQILGITSAPSLIAAPKNGSQVTTGPVQTSGPIADTVPKQEWTDIAVPVPDAYAGGTPGFYDFTGEEGPPSAIAPGTQQPQQAPARFPWWLVAIGAALFLGT